jgi:hypothetical protein
MQLLLSRAGLALNPGQVADLVLAWRQMAGLIASIPHDRPLADDMAVAFRLPPPALVPAVQAAPRARPRHKAKPKAKAKAAPPKRKARRKQAARKTARRGR